MDSLFSSLTDSIIFLLAAAFVATVWALHFWADMMDRRFTRARRKWDDSPEDTDGRK